MIPFLHTEVFLITQTTKIFQVPFAHEQKFFQNTKSKIFCPLDSPRLSSFLVYAPLSATFAEKTSAGILPFGVQKNFQKIKVLVF